jgi:hypothetical protein
MRELRVVTVGNVGLAVHMQAQSAMAKKLRAYKERKARELAGTESTTLNIVRAMETEAAGKPVRGVFGRVLATIRELAAAKGPMGGQVPAPGPAPAPTTSHPGYAAPAPSLMDRLKGRK